MNSKRCFILPLVVAAWVGCFDVDGQRVFAVPAALVISTATGNGADATIWGRGDGGPDGMDENHGFSGGLSARSRRDMRKIYLRFELPEDLGPVSDVRLELFYTRTTGSNRSIDVFGLLESDDYGVNALTGEQRLDEFWNEGEITWNNAPGNADGPSDTSFNHAVFLYAQPTPGIPQTVVSPSGVLAANLIDFINSDTNGVVTLMINRSASTAISAQFTSREGTGGAQHAPRLVLELGDPRVPILPFGSVWKYLDDGSNQGVAWRAGDFDDSTWSQGPAQLGYGDEDEATVVDCGPSFPDCNAGNRATTYFRTTFEIDSAAGNSGLSIGLLRDDAAAVFLNDVEVFRDANLPTGAAFDSYATDSGAENGVVGFSVSGDLLVDGENVLAVEVHQASGASSDVSFDLRATLTPPKVELVALGSVWKYLDNGGNPTAAWTGPSFDDALWAEGPAQLGYGDDDEATVVNCGPSAPACDSSNQATTFFRHAFDVQDVTLIESLEAEVLRDDAAAVYLNGTEVFRDANLATGAASTTFAMSLGAENGVTTFRLDPALLVNGTNVLAVEVHQESALSSDISFDLQLTAAVTPIPEPTTLVLAAVGVLTLATFRRGRSHVSPILLAGNRGKDQNKR